MEISENRANMSDIQKERLPLSKWEAQMLRLTVFPSPAADIVTHNWWEELVGEPPVDVRSQPRMGSRQEGGPFARGKLVLNIEPIRIDWLYTNVSDPNSPSVSVGPFEENLGLFQELVERWFNLETAPSAVRLAFGAILLAPAETREEGYRQLSPYLPFDLDPVGSRDFLYQINRPRAPRSKIEGLSINRLTKWSVMSSHEVLFAVTPDKSEQIGIEKVRYACRLELDINTSPEFEGELSREEQSGTFRELVEIGTEIVLEGDVS